jgi:hypothetical protein
MIYDDCMEVSAKCDVTSDIDYVSCSTNYSYLSIYSLNEDDSDF